MSVLLDADEEKPGIQTKSKRIISIMNISPAGFFFFDLSKRNRQLHKKLWIIILDQCKGDVSLEDLQQKF